MMLDTLHITGRQIAAARALASMSQVELARESQLSLFTIRRMERSEGPPQEAIYNVIAVRLALEKRRVIFLPAGKDIGAGVATKKPT